MNPQNKRHQSKNDPLSAQMISSISPIIEQKLDQLAKNLEYSLPVLQFWTQYWHSSFVNLSSEQSDLALLSIAHLIEKYSLDPLLGDLQIWQEEGTLQVGMSMSGLIRLLHRQPQFQGIGFTESDQLINAIPAWIECAITRQDYAHPIVAREYLLEVKKDTSLWQEMPRRMLKHRATQQAARYAFGIAFHQSVGRSQTNNADTKALQSKSPILRTQTSKTQALKEALTKGLAEQANSPGLDSIN